MLNRKKLIIFIISILILAFAGHVSASGVGETISIEGYVDSAGKNSLYVSGKILVANEYSSISTGGTNIFVGDYVMGFIYLNEDMQSYTIVSLTKIPERSIGTPTPLPQSTATPVWADLFMTTPTVSGSGLNLLSDGWNDQESDPLFEQPMVSAQTAVPTATPSSISFEGVVSDMSANRIVINGTEYVIDNATGYIRKAFPDSFRLIFPPVLYTRYGGTNMEIDQAVLKCLSENLAGKRQDVIDRFPHRIAVFSDNPKALNTGEISMKSKLWKLLDEAIEAGITTLYTGLSYGGDSAAAEHFAQRKQTNSDLRIVHIQQSKSWFSEIEPCLKGFAANTLIKSTDYATIISGPNPEKSKLFRDQFIIDQCLHIVFLTDLEDDSENLYSWQLFSYATSSHKNSISHQIHMIGCAEPYIPAEPEKPAEPRQDSLF